MPLSKTETLLSNHRFLLFLISQSFVSCGAFIQVVAAARLILDRTNSGLAAGYGILCAPIPGIIFSLIAGGIGDRLKTRVLLIAFDILRGIFVLLFIFSKTMPTIFIIMLLVSTLDIMYSPPKNKMLTSILEKDELIRGNSLLGGSNGVVSLVIPMLTGLVISVFSIHTALIMAGVSYFFSAFFLSCMHPQPHGQQTHKRSSRQEITKGLIYCFRTLPLKRAVLALAVFDFGAACVNIAFYSLAFDKLHVTSSYWGALLSVFYGMNVVAMALLLQYKKKFQKAPVIKALLLQIAVVISWVYYSTTYNLYYILISVAAEGLCSAVGTTLLTTHILEVSKKEYTARVMSIRELCSSIAKIAGIGLAYFLLKYWDVDAVFIISALFVFVSIVIQSSKWFGSNKPRRFSGGALADYPK